LRVDLADREAFHRGIFALMRARICARAASLSLSERPILIHAHDDDECGAPHVTSRAQIIARDALKDSKRDRSK
jgi:hypothetical protein